MLSVVIPTLDSGRHLEATLESLAGADEIVVADGGSTDSTADVARRHGARLAESPKGRGVQLRAGAQAASGDWLLFLHADTVPGPLWLEAVERHIASGPGCAGWFRFRLADPAWQARVIERGVALRSRLLGLPYGDQGLLVSRSLYDAVGGYRPLPLMEDVDIVRRIGRRRLRRLGESASTSAERFRRDGWLRRSSLNLGLLAMYGFGASPERLAKLYG